MVIAAAKGTLGRPPDALDLQHTAGLPVHPTTPRAKAVWFRRHDQATWGGSALVGRAEGLPCLVAHRDARHRGVVSLENRSRPGHPELEPPRTGNERDRTGPATGYPSPSSG